MGTDREADKLKIKQILTATVVSLCNNGLSFDSELCVEGLLGITLDRKEVLLVNIKETISSALKKKPKPPESQSQGGRQPQTTPNKQQQQSQQKQQLHQQQQQQQQASRLQQQQQQQPQQTARKQQQSMQQEQQPRTPGKSSAAQDSYNNVKAEPLIPKVVSESQTQCMAVQPYGGGYSQVQKSVKMVQNAQGVVEQKQMEWKTYTADGRVVEHKKVKEVQTVAPSGVPAAGGYVGQPMQGDISGTMPGYQSSNIKMEPGCEEDMYGQQEPEMYYEGEEQGYEDDYSCMRDAYGTGQESYLAGGYQVPGQQYDPGMDGMSDMYNQGGSASRSRVGGTKKPPTKRPKKEKMPTGTPGKTPTKKTMKAAQMGPAAVDPSVSRNTPTKNASKEVNSSLVQRALDMVHEGKLSAATAINLFGIPKSTFYKKLATSNVEKGHQFMEGDFVEGMEDAWDDGMQGVYDPMDPSFANYSA